MGKLSDSVYRNFTAERFSQEFAQARMSKHPDVKSLLARGWKLGEASVAPNEDYMEMHMIVIFKNGSDTSRVIAIENEWFDYDWWMKLWQLTGAM